jgi:hypothetical protein
MQEEQALPERAFRKSIRAPPDANIFANDIVPVHRARLTFSRVGHGLTIEISTSVQN